MDALATVDGLLRGVGSQLGVTLSLDEDGRCALDCGPGLTVFVAVPEGAELLLFYAPLLRHSSPAARPRSSAASR